MRTLLVHFLIAAIGIYQKTISPDHGIFRAALGPVCKFEPTCSSYAIDSLRKHGLGGILLAVKRIGRCHPFAAGGFDPVPPKKTHLV